MLATAKIQKERYLVYRQDAAKAAPMTKHVDAVKARDQTAFNRRIPESMNACVS
jgi:hypothetical protein